MEDQTPLRVLCLDGGGVRGLSSLIMLNAILAEMQLKLVNEFKPLKPIPPIRPCQIFDLICGTSTGGLIALMLGRLEMTVDEAIHAYKELSQKVFTSILQSDTAKFDHNILEQQIKAIIESSRLNLDSDSPLEDPSDDACKTFVVAATPRDGGSATRMRTYTSDISYAFPGLIWEAARATSAALTFFEPISIDGEIYADGGIGWNNPSEEAIAEACQIWGKRKIGCLVSLGTGLESALQLGDDEKTLKRQLLDKVLPKQSRLIDVAKHCVNCLTSSDKVHRRLCEDGRTYGVEGVYFRFNVPQGMSNIGLEEWEKIGDMTTLTKSYMRADGRASRDAVARILLEPWLPSSKYQSSDTRNSEPQYFMVPQWCQQNPHFVGREGLLETLRKELCDEKPNKFNHRVALFGMGGVGKTQVAIEYVVKYKGRYNAVFWITATDPASLLLGFQQIARVTECGGTVPLDADSVAGEVLKWLKKQRSWLFVLDNVDNISVVHAYLPDVSSGDSHVLITTRNRDASGIPAEGLEVAVFESEAAADLLLLRTNLGDNPIAAIRSEAAIIVGELGFLALAIEQAAAFIRESLKDIFKFLAIYSANRKKMHALRPRQNWAYEYVVSTTWLLSFEVVKNQNPNAVQLLKLLAFLNPDEILVEFLEVGKGGLPEPFNTLVGDALELYTALGDLEQFSLIRRSDDGRIVSIHRLIQQVIRDNLSDQDRRRFMELVTGLFLCAFPEFEQDNRQTCRKYQTQVVGPLLAITELNTEQVAEVLLRVGYFLYSDGKYQDGEQFESRAVDMYTGLYGAEDARTLLGMSNLAATYHDLGKTKEAADLHKKVLKARVKTLGEEHEDTLLSMNNLAVTYHALGQMKESADMHEKALEVRKRTLGEQHQHTLCSMCNLGDTYYALGRRKEAADLHEKVLETRLKSLGGEHPDTLLTMNNLASTYLALGQTKEAVNLHEKVLEEKMKTLGENHPDTLMTMNNLALAYYALGRKMEAARMHEKVKESYTRTLGEEHPITLLSMSNLASTYNSLGQTKEGDALHEIVLGVRLRTLGKEHPDTWFSIYNLAAAYWNSGRRSDAIELFERELDCRRAQGAETATCMENLACRYREIGRVEDAVQLELDLKRGEIGQK